MQSGRKQPRNGNPGELALLKQIRARAEQLSHGIAHGGLRLGIGDDCALLRIGAGEELAVTTDLSISGRHFRMDWQTPESIGHRTLARGLSDLAAMGARPVAAFLSLGIPKELVQNAKGREPWPGERLWLDRFFDGFLALASALQTPVAGGDLAESPLAVADIVLVGAVRRGKALLRSGARPGDLLYVTGTLGGAAAGLARLAQLAAKANAARPGSKRIVPLRIPGKLKSLLAPHLDPQPRIAQGLRLAQRGLASAAIDLSDGLSSDLAHLCEESHVAAEVDAAALPIHSGATLQQALHGGEDYELLFTASPQAHVPRRIAGVSVTRIGRILRPRQGRPAVALVTVNGTRPLAPQGWEHFS
ncbi:MAG TPA: thiamine-phosphate kinase [Terracidiphilus sp.]|nr:thiamine-phosphate kinase [Terracidiphilus sp.]